MINWKEEINLTLHKFGINKQVDYSEGVDWIIHMYVDCKMSLNQIADEVFNNRISSKSIRDLLLEENIPLRSRGGSNNPKKVTMQEQDLRTLTMRECCHKYSVGMSTVHKWRKIFNVKGKNKLRSADCIYPEPEL